MRFAHTKIQPPQSRADLLSRPALEREVAHALAARRVVLLCAPAGYGKTALLADAVRLLPARHALAWVSVDPEDDLPRLLECLVAALEPFELPWRTAPEGLILAAASSEEAVPATVVAELVNTLEATDTEHGIIVLDDLHHVEDPTCLAFLAQFLQRLGSRWTVAITARHEPPLRLARMRARGEVFDVGQAQLQFDRDEVSQLLAALGQDLSQAEALHRRTGGWVAGLRLAMGSSGAADTGPAIDRQTFDFFSSEVLAGIEPKLREFLLLTSVLHELEPARCAALSGDADAVNTLDRIERLGLFVSVVDASVPTLRLHDLFRDALLRRLRLERADMWVPLHERAAMVEPDPVRRQTLLLAAGSHEQGARALQACALTLMTQGSVHAVLRLLERYPPDFVERSAELHHVAGTAKFSVWDTRMAEWHLARAEALYADRADMQKVALVRAQRAITLIGLGRLLEAGQLLQSVDDAALDGEGRIYLRMALTWQALEDGRFNAVAPLFAAAMQALEAQPEIEKWSFTIPPPRQSSCRAIAPFLERWAAGAVTVSGDRPVALRASGLLTQGWVLLWQGHFAAARDLLMQAESDAEWTGRHMVVRSHALALRSLLDALCGHTSAALQAMESRIAERPATFGHWGMWHTYFYACRIAIVCRDAAAAGEWLARLEAVEPGLPEASPQRLWPKHGLRGSVAWLAGRHDEAFRHWQLAFEQEERSDLLGQVNEIRMRQAAGLVQQGRLDEASALIAPVLEGATPGGAVLAADACAALAATDWKGRLDANQAATLQRWSALLGQASPSTAPAAAEPGRTGGLSLREQEVLACIAAGDSNKLIARSMDISLYTVKRHVANILNKLGVASRGQAAAWHRVHGTAQRGEQPT
jgi:LuxR family maltose regulon positive regulatory protein